MLSNIQIIFNVTLIIGNKKLVIVLIIKKSSYKKRIGNTKNIIILSFDLIFFFKKSYSFIRSVYIF